MRRILGSTAMVLLTSLISGLGPTAPRANAATSRSSKDQNARVIHLLNRMTFGPTPGEVQSVEQMGIDRWLTLQLHPNQIDDSALDPRLANDPAPFLSPEQMMMRFPPGNLIRQALKGRLDVPTSEPQRAVWESRMAIVRQRRLAKGQQAMVASAAMTPVTRMKPTSVTRMTSMDDMGGSGHPDATDTAQTPSTDAPSTHRMPRQLDDRSAAILALAPEQRYQRLLKMQPGQMPGFVRSLPVRDRPGLVAGMTPPERETIIALINPRLVVVNETQAVRVLKDIYSQRELQRVMTEFWLNHFNIYTNKNQIEPYYLSQFENQVIAPRALGKFEDLLDAVAQSPAMLIYLDNVQSIGPDSLAALRREHPGVPRYDLMQMSSADAKAMRGPVPSQFHNRPRSGINENYGRELMELHTVGVNGGYTQQDVIEAARVLTGWTVAPPRQGGGFRFVENRHEPGTKIVMGHKIKNGGQNEGFELLHILATSPATAHFISQELAVRFVSDHPSQALVNRMAKTFLATQGDIAKVLKTMIESPEFWSAPDTGNKIKTPLDYVVSAVRATDADVTQPYRLVSELKAMGMPLTGTEQPNGYAMTNDAWASSAELIDRMNFALALASNRIPGVQVSLDQLLRQSGGAQTPDGQEARLEQLILHGPAPARTHAAIMRALGGTRQQDRAAASIVLAGDRGANPFEAGNGRPDTELSAIQQAFMAGLLIGSPEFQRR